MSGRAENEWPDFRGKAAVVEWHAALQESKGERAALRRATTVNEALAVPAVYRLARIVAPGFGPEAAEWSGSQRQLVVDALARSAMIAAAVEPHRWDDEQQQKAPHGGKWEPKTLGSALGAPRREIREERFRALAGAEAPELFMRLLRGVVAQLAGRVPLSDTMQTVFEWHFSRSRRFAQRKLMIGYYNARIGADEEDQVPLSEATEAEPEAAE